MWESITPIESFKYVIRSPTPSSRNPIPPTPTLLLSRTNRSSRPPVLRWHWHWHWRWQTTPGHSRAQQIFPSNSSSKRMLKVDEISSEPSESSLHYLTPSFRFKFTRTHFSWQRVLRRIPQVQESQLLVYSNFRSHVLTGILHRARGEQLNLKVVGG